MRKIACVVDASPTIRVVLEINLASVGFAVRACADGDTLLAWLAVTKIVPDVVLLDIDSSGNGVDLISRIQRAADQRCVLLLLLASVPDEDQRREWEMYGMGFLQKPFMIEDLLALIATLKVSVSPPSA